VAIEKIMQKMSQEKGIDVLLIYMPVCELSPSIGLGLLKSALSPLGVSTKILYFNLQFAKWIGVDAYLKTLKYSTRFNQVGEWIFSGALFEQSKSDIENYIEKILLRPSQSLRRFLTPVPGRLIQTVLKVRGKVDRFLNESQEEVLSYHPRIVGFSSAFQQQVASLALAKRIKYHSPETFIVFGGSNCEGIMGAEMIRQFSFIDAVVSGEGDIIFPQLVQRVLRSAPLNGLQGVYTQTGPIPAPNHGRYPNAASVQHMDALPYPDYDDFFDQLEKSCNHLPYPSSIPIETSRGCWWHDRMCCTFCAFNRPERKYRSKSSKRVLNELTHLLQKYTSDTLQIVDNILDIGYFKTLLPKLSARRLNIEFFCNLRSNLTKEQVRMLRKAGFRTILPGIESLSTPVLKLMRKGVGALQNIQLLKWCKEFGILPYWNLLCGFPSEPAEEYERMARLIPLLVHLSPAGRAGLFHVDRFSPNFEYAEQFGLTDVTPAPGYHYIYPFGPETVFNLAYSFTYDYRSEQKVEEYMRPMIKAWMAWKLLHKSSDLFFADRGKKLYIWDQRPIATKPLTILSDLQRALYIACDRIQGLSQLKKIAKTHIGKDYSQEMIEQLLQPIIDSYLMIRDGNSYLSLAIPVGNYIPERKEFGRFQRYLHELEIQNRHEALMKKIKIKEISKDLKINEEEIVKLKI